MRSREFCPYRSPYTVVEVASILRLSEAKIHTDLQSGELCANAEIVTGGGHTIRLPNMFDVVDFEAKRIFQSFGVSKNEAFVLIQEVWPEICSIVEAGGEQMIYLLSETAPTQKEIVYSVWRKTRSAPNEIGTTDISTAVSRIFRLTLLLLTNTWKTRCFEVYKFELDELQWRGPHTQTHLK